jgi:hypothetical protein
MMPAALEGYIESSTGLGEQQQAAGPGNQKLQCCSRVLWLDAFAPFLLKTRSCAARVNAANYLRPPEAAMLAPMALMLSLQKM